MFMFGRERERVSNVISLQSGWNRCYLLYSTLLPVPSLCCCGWSNFILAALGSYQRCALLSLLFCSLLMFLFFFFCRLALNREANASCPSPLMCSGNRTPAQAHAACAHERCSVVRSRSGGPALQSQQQQQQHTDSVSTPMVRRQLLAERQCS